MSARSRHNDPKKWVNEWLDDESESVRHTRPKAKKRLKKDSAPALDPKDANATVTEVYPKLCRVRMDQGNSSVLCQYRRKQVFERAQGEWRERTPVAVGDRVKVEATGSDGVVEGVAGRKNFLARPAPGKEDQKLIHVLAANVDCLVIVTSVQRPEFSPGLVDRFLIAAQVASIPVELVVNKSDLSHPNRSWEFYQNLGIPVTLVSAHTGEQIEAFRKKLTGKRVVFAGHSGVGKTSLLRALLKEDIGRVGEVSDFTGKGKHTTTGAVLFATSENSEWIDTPGVRSFGLFNLEPEALSQYFPEFQGLSCTERGCLHVGEERCDATSLFRYPSYLRIFKSMNDEEEE